MPSSPVRCIHPPTAVQIVERSLVDICELLEADRIELLGPSVAFLTALPHGEGIRWDATLGDYLVSTAGGWRVTSERPATTILPSAA